MAMNGGTAAVAGRRRHRRRPVMSEINVTPMVDVMLVLLIIFMVSAPLLTVGVAARPAADPGQEPRPGQGAADRFGQRARARSSSRIPKFRVEELVPKLKAITEARGGAERAHLRAGRPARCDYGTVMKVMGRLSAAGFRRVALVTEIEQGAR